MKSEEYPRLRWFIWTLRNGTGSEMKPVVTPSPAGLVRDEGFGRESRKQNQHGVEKHAVKQHEREPEGVAKATSAELSLWFITFHDRN